MLFFLLDNLFPNEPSIVISCFPSLFREITSSNEKTDNGYLFPKEMLKFHELPNRLYVHKHDRTYILFGNYDCFYKLFLHFSHLILSPVLIR